MLATLLTLWLAAFARGAEPVDYDRDIKSLLGHKCGACHGTLRQQADLRLDAAELMRVGGDSGPVIVPGNPDDSLLIQRVVEADSDLRMPPEGEGEPLTPDQVDLLRRWVRDGATAPADEVIPAAPHEHWAYRSPQRPEIPQVTDANWVRNPIDAFVASARERQGLPPSPAATRETWLRRVYLNLLGVPPTRERLLAFLADTSPTAYERVVDELLQRPEYGQRWGRHWMDVWRYSDWYGSRSINEIRYSQRHIWRWRDWIVDSLNVDKPYDQMIREMLAADEIAPADPEALPATGYLARNWYKFDRNVWMFDTVEHTAQALLGLTLRCARCHDHKYDPITQQDYYRFRAFFEPHQVRTDPLRFDAPEEKDATLGMVLSEGIARVFDAQPDSPTFLFRRGDDRSPDESQPLTPGVPEALGNASLTIRPIDLPPESFYPNLRPEMTVGLLTQAQQKVTTAQAQLASAESDRDQADRAIAAYRERAATSGIAQAEAGATPQDEVGQAYLDDDFSIRSDRWEVVSGDWIWQDGVLAQRTVSNFATIVASDNHPQDFRAVVRYRTLEPGNYRSVGFSFDYIDQGNSQDVYTSVNNSAPSVQAFHRLEGKQEYPPAGIVKTPLSVGTILSLEVVVRGQRLTVAVDGEPKLEYTLPVARREGRFALWVHNGAAEFLDVAVRPLPLTEQDRERQLRAAEGQLELAGIDLRTAVAEVESLEARIAAERAKHFGESDAAVAAAARIAVRAQRQVEALRAERVLLQAERHHESLVATADEIDSDAAGSETAIQQAQQAVAAAQESLAVARRAAESGEGDYDPLGPTFPATSTGRRAALAGWITRPDHPRTARVAVNQIWLRHFGQALVPTVSNFGLNGQPPSHPELLDWLATELVAGDWKMKPLHRMIVLSSTYRQSSATNGAADSVTSDPENRWLWRMNSRRMEAEVVRDAVLFVAGNLDLEAGGPEIAETEDQTVPRRSFYFRNTPNEQVPFLNAFDMASPNECYERRESVVPQQALALLNSGLVQKQSRVLAERLSRSVGDGDDDATRVKFVTMAWESVLGRQPTAEEAADCQRFLVESSSAAVKPPRFPSARRPPLRPPSDRPTQRARENLIHVLFSHNDFVTIR